MFKTIICLLVLIIPFSSFAQVSVPQLSIETGGQASLGSYAPFLMTSNRHDAYGIDKNMCYTRISIIKDTSRKFDYIYGLDGIGRLDETSHLILQQGYLGFKLSKFILYAGVKEETFGNQDKLLSSGGVLWSGNARPMPKVSLSTIDYVNFPCTNGWLQVKAGISHGWFGEKYQYVKNAYLHDKYFFAKINFNTKWAFHFGLHHAAMWSGTSSDTTVGKLPSGLQNFLKVFFVKSGGEAHVPTGEFNTIGNHVASYQFRLDYSGNQFDYALYMQTFLEDKNGRIDYHFDRKNRPDGLWGLSIKNRDENAFFRAFLAEYMHSVQQSGDPLKSGDDNYFNNYVYKTGWQYYNMTIGTPLITSPAYINGSIEAGRYILNNKVTAFHLGLLGMINGNLLTLKNTFTINEGNLLYPYDPPKIQNFTYLGYTYKFKKYQNLLLMVESGIDVGKLLKNNFGIRCAVKKTF